MLKVLLFKLYDNDNHIIFTAKENSKKKAEQKVSKLALYKFKQLSDDQMNDSDIEIL